MALRRTAPARVNVLMTTMYAAPWESVPKIHFSDPTALPIVGSKPMLFSEQTALGRKLRGSGLHGVERTDVLRLVLYNRLKQKRPQRTFIPTLEQNQEIVKIEVQTLWFCIMIYFVYWPWFLYGDSYAARHDHYPWTMPRTDGSRGPGPRWWWME